MPGTVERFTSVLADRYAIQRELGRGGMATVYLAEDLKHHRLVALKVLRPELAVTLGPDRLLREIELLARLTHPHILPLHDSGNADGFLYYVMPYVEGQPLRDRLTREKQLPVDDALQITRELADALSYAHSHGVIHRDIKPENILLEAGHAVLADFGIARAIDAAGGHKLTETGVILGTPAYMSPEQAGGSKELDGRSDLYSLGCVLYEMLAGEPPFTGPTAESVIHQHLAAEPPSITNIRPSVPGWAVAALTRALAKTPADRFNRAALFAEALAPRPSAAPALSPTTPPPARARPSGRRIALLSGAAVVVLAGALVVGRWLRPGTAMRTSPPQKIESLAVLPLENLSGYAGQEYLSDGMTEALITSLAKIKALRVISRTSAMRFKGSSKPLREIAPELNVDAIVQGSVQRAGERVQVTVQLIHVATDQHLWAESYQRDFRDVLDLQNDVARAIANEISITLSPQEQARLTSAHPVNPEAYHDYLMGLYHQWKTTADGHRLAIAYFQEAIRKDPEFALGYAGLTSVLLYSGGLLSDRGSAARAAAMKALELDPNLGEAHRAMAEIKYKVDWDWEAAEEEFQRALELSPNDALAHHEYSHYLIAAGRPEESLRESKAAVEIDPLAAGMVMHLGWHYLQVREVDLAIAEYERALSLDANLAAAHAQAGIAYEVKGKFEEAVAHYLKAKTLDGAGPAEVEAFRRAFRTSGMKGYWKKQLEIEERRRANGEAVDPGSMALIHEILGNRGVALDWLEKACKERPLDPAWLMLDPRLANLLSEPRIQALLRRTGPAP